MTIELSDVPEPVMAQFDRLPLPMQMRVAARVLKAVNLRDQGSESGVWWPTALLEYADRFEREDYAIALANHVAETDSG